MIGNIKYKNANGGEIEFDFPTGIVISSIDGLTENFVNLSTSQGINQIGTTVNGVAVDEKTLTIEGAFLGYSNDKAALLLNTILPEIEAELIYNDEWTITVYPTETPHVEQRDYSARFQFAVRASYPYFSKTEQTTTSLVGIEPQFVFWDLTKPYTFGTRISALFTNVENKGNVEALYGIIFRANAAGVKYPKITNAVTYEYLRIKKTMALNERIIVTIKSDGPSVVSDINDNVTDIIGYFDIESDLYRMHPGDNIIAYDAEEGKGSLDVMIFHNVGTAWVRGR